MANFAVIQTGGKQYLVKPGDVLRVEKLEAKDATAIKFDALLVADDTGKEVQVGKPTVKGAVVSATVLRRGRADKIRIIKFKAKVRFKRKAGHRQPFTEIRIDGIKA
jgi:large subunit ribosomal protein L21